MNGYWKREAVSIAEAMEMARKLWLLCDKDIKEHGRYWAKGGNVKMRMADAPDAWIYVWFSPWERRSGVTVERQGLRERMTYSPRMTLLETDNGWLSKRMAWRHEPSRRDEMDDLNKACVSALERYRNGLKGGGAWK